MGPAPARRWVGVPAEERQARRRELLLDAAYDLIGTHGWDRTTVRAVCASARLNPRYFYESFADPEALLVAVYDRVVEELGTHTMAAIEEAGDGPGARLRAVVSSSVAFVDDDRRRARVLYVEALGNEALNRRRIDTARAVAATALLFAGTPASATGRDGSSPNGKAPRDPIGAMAAAVLVGGYTELLVDWLAGRIKCTRDQLVDDAVALLQSVVDAATTVARSRKP